MYFPGLGKVIEFEVGHRKILKYERVRIMTTMVTTIQMKSTHVYVCVCDICVKSSDLCC